MREAILRAVRTVAIAVHFTARSLHTSTHQRASDKFRGMCIRALVFRAFLYSIVYVYDTRLRFPSGLALIVLTLRVYIELLPVVCPGSPRDRYPALYLLGSARRYLENDRSTKHLVRPGDSDPSPSFVVARTGNDVNGRGCRLRGGQ